MNAYLLQRVNNKNYLTKLINGLIYKYEEDGKDKQIFQYEIIII